MSTIDTSLTWAYAQIMNKWILTTISIALLAFIIHPLVFHPAIGMHEPTSMQLPFLIILTIFESLALGLGITFLIFGYSQVKNSMIASKRQNLAVLLSISWLLSNWWIHDGLHMANGMNMTGLIYIEYTFHVTLILAGAILAYAFVQNKALRKK